MMKVNKKGSSMVELVAVLVIMGIIAAIAVPSVSALLKKTRIKAAQQDINTLVAEINNYRKSNDITTNDTYMFEKGKECTENGGTETSPLHEYLYEGDNKLLAEGLYYIMVSYEDKIAYVSGVYTKDGKYYKFLDSTQEDGYKAKGEFKTADDAMMAK